MSGPSPLRARLAAALLVAAIIVVTGIRSTLPFSAHRGGEAVGIDAPAYVRIARTILSTGSLVLPGPGRIEPDSQQHLETAFGTPWSLSRDGRLLPKHSWAFGLLLVPGVALGGAVGAMVEAMLLGALLAGFVTFRVARDFGPMPAAAAALSLLWLSRGGSDQIDAINVELAIALTLFGALACAAEGHPLAAGLLAGLSPLWRPTAPVLFLAIPFILAERKRRGEARWALAGFALGLLPSAVVNTWAFGAPWITAYQRSVAFRGGVFHLESHGGAFHGNVLSGLAQLFLTPEGGLLVAAPAAILALAGFLLPGARTAERFVTSLVTLAAYLSLAPYSFLTEMPGASYRFAFPFIVASVAPLAALLSWLVSRSRRT